MKKKTDAPKQPSTDATQAELDRHLNRFVTTAWAADYLCVSEDTIRREVARGNLTAYSVSTRNIRFRVRDIEALAHRLAS